MTKAPVSFMARLKRHHVFRVATVFAISAYFLIQVSNAVFPDIGLSRADVRYLIAGLALLFPVALVLGWMFIPPSRKRSSEYSRWQKWRWRLGPELTLVILAFVTISGVYLWRANARYVQSAQAHPLTKAGTTGAAMAIPAKSIAVLPFVNDSGDSKQRYFSDGLTEDLIIAFSQYHGLKVIGRESSFQMRDTKLNSKAIGETLGVAHLLEGSVSRAGDKIRVRAELVNAADGSTLWSQHYDRPYKDLFALQDEITQAVATALKARLLGGGTEMMQTDRPPSGNLEAYNAYLEGNYYRDQFSVASFKQAITAYQQAIKLDPHYAAAYAQLSITWSYLGRYSSSRPMDLQHANAKARAAADTAVRLDPNLAAAHLARGYTMWANLEWVESEPEFRKAYKLAPGSTDAIRLRGASLQTLGHLKESIGLFHQAIAANPLDNRPYYDLSLALFGLGRTEDAIQTIDKAISLAPTAAVYHAVLAWYEVGNGQAEAALQAAEKEPSPVFRAWGLALAHAATGDKVKADTALQNLITQYADVAPYFIADTYAFRQQRDEALAWLNRTCKQRDSFLEILARDPYLLRYRNDPRFASVCRKEGIQIPILMPAGSASTAPTQQ